MKSTMQNLRSHQYKPFATLMTLLLCVCVLTPISYGQSLIGVTAKFDEPWDSYVERLAKRGYLSSKQKQDWFAGKKVVAKSYFYVTKYRTETLGKGVESSTINVPFNDYYSATCTLPIRGSQSDANHFIGFVKDVEKKIGEIVDPSARFPVTVYGPQQKLEIDPEDPPNAVAGQGRRSILHQRGEKLRSTSLVNGLLQMYSRSGRVMWTIPCRRSREGREQGAIAIDSRQQRIYVSEEGDSEGWFKSRTSAFDFHGNRLWSIAAYGGLTIDPTTGNLWIATNIETIVVDVSGKLIKSIPVRATTLAYDRNTDSVWLARRHVLHISKDFETLYKSAGVARRTLIFIDEEDGTVWTGESYFFRDTHSHNALRQESAEGKGIRGIKLPAAPKRLEPGKAGQLIVNGDSDSWVLDKKTGEIEPFRKNCLAAADKFAIWIHEKTRVSAIDFDDKELFSVSIQGPQDWKQELNKCEENARMMAAKFPADDARVSRSQQVVDDWKSFIEGSQHSADGPPFGSANEDAFYLFLIRD